MSKEFQSIHNVQERAVLDEVARVAALRPDSTPALHPDLLADVACVALNRVPPRYIRFDVDWSFYLTDQERQAQTVQVRTAVAEAFDYVVDRLRARERLR